MWIWKSSINLSKSLRASLQDLRFIMWPYWGMGEWLRGLISYTTGASWWRGLMGDGERRLEVPRLTVTRQLWTFEWVIRVWRMDGQRQRSTPPAARGLRWHHFISTSINQGQADIGFLLNIGYLPVGLIHLFLRRQAALWPQPFMWRLFSFKTRQVSGWETAWIEWFINGIDGNID